VVSPVCLPARLRRCCAEGFGAFACKVGLSQPPALFVSPATPLCCCRWLHGLQAQLIDGVLFLDVRFMVAGLGRRMRRHLRCRRLQHRLHYCFPDATQQQLARDPCPICLSRSFWWYRSCCCCCSSLPTVPPSSLPRPLPHCLPLLQAGKQLPCSHVMHVSCLCAWLQQSSAGSCPLCRASLELQQQPPQQQPQRRPWLQHLGIAAQALVHAPVGQAAIALLNAGQPLPQPSRRAPLPSSRAFAGSLPGSCGDLSMLTLQHSQAAPAVQPVSSPPAHPAGSSRAARTRPRTRLQARLAAALTAAEASATAAMPALGHCRANRHPSRVDSILD
jgi:hypothetical protein